MFSPSPSLPSAPSSKQHTAPGLEGLTGRRCYLQLRAFPLQDDPSSDLGLPPAPALTAAACSPGLWRGVGITGRPCQLSLGQGVPRSPLPTPAPRSHSLPTRGCHSLRGLGSLSGPCVLPPGHTCDSEGLFVEDQSPHSHPFPFLFIFNKF